MSVVRPKGLKALNLSSLTIEDASSFKHVGLFADLSEILDEARYEFLVPTEGSIPWDRALFLNLTFWDEHEARDVLTEAEIPADVLMHVGWHFLGNRFLAPSPEAELLSEAIASAFDLYLVGRLLGHAPDSTFLASQVPQMAEVAVAAGLDDDEFEALLEDVAKDPDQAFEDLRKLLFAITTRLIPVTDASRACEVLASFDEHRFAPLLHHYELTTWITKARLSEKSTHRAKTGAQREAREVHDVLSSVSSSIEWLEKEWVRRTLGTAKDATTAT